MQQLGTKQKGFMEAIIGCICWGLSGAVAQFGFTQLGLTPLWLVGVRLFFAGVLLLLWAGLHQGRQLFALWHDGRAAGRLVCFALLGMMPSQVTYFLAIRYGNAATATVLQFLGPFFIMAVVAMNEHQWPARKQLLAGALALVGTVLLVTGGRLDHLALAPLALFWGIAAGVAQASYTLLPRPLLRDYDQATVIGWSMLIGSLPFAGNVLGGAQPTVTATTWLAIGFIVFVGTICAYGLYLASLSYITPTTTGLLSAFEPLTATLVAVLALGTNLSLAAGLGIGLILLTTVLQALPLRLRRL